MKLQIESIDISAVKTGSKTFVKDRILSVNTKELAELISEDSRISHTDIQLVSPGDNVRIINLLDIVQPRCKIDASGSDFPGFVDELQIAGKGKTRSLRGVTVMISNPSNNRDSAALLDMCGPAAQLSMYAEFNHISITPYKAADISDHDFEDAVKVAGLKAAVYLAKSAEDHPVDDVEVFELDMLKSDTNSTLPRVAYFYQLYTPQHDHHGISDSNFYGRTVTGMMPTILHPNEILDGGVLAPTYTLKAMDTYKVQNHAMVKELYRRHNKDLIFAGVVAGVANTDTNSRVLTSKMASHLLCDVLSADGVVLTKINGGMPHVDLGMVAEECECLGIKTSIFSQAFHNEGSLADTLLFNNEKLDLIISSAGLEEEVTLPRAEKVIGGKEDTRIYCTRPIDQYANDAHIDVREFEIAGVHDLYGGAKVILKEY